MRTFAGITTTGVGSQAAREGCANTICLSTDLLVVGYLSMATMARISEPLEDVNGADADEASSTRTEAMDNAPEKVSESMLATQYALLQEPLPSRHTLQKLIPVLNANNGVTCDLDHRLTKNESTTNILLQELIDLRRHATTTEIEAR